MAKLPSLPKTPLVGQFIRAAVSSTASHATARLAQEIAARQGSDSLLARAARAGQAVLEHHAAQQHSRFEEHSETARTGTVGAQLRATLMDTGLGAIREQQQAVQIPAPQDCFALGQRAKAAGDDVQAFGWYRMGALQGHTGAMNSYGVCFDTGQGTAQDPKEADRWYRMAAEAGHVDAQGNLAILLFEAGNHAEAVRWSRSAAGQGHGGGQYLTAHFHHHGLGGVRADRSEAIRWYRLAAAQDVAEAHAPLAELEAQERRNSAEQQGHAAEAAKMPRAVALDILGLLEGATDAEVQASYARLMQLVHPDKGGTTFMAQQLNAARKVLLG
jgi:TPR repeat protein